MLFGLGEICDDVESSNFDSFTIEQQRSKFVKCSSADGRIMILLQLHIFTERTRKLLG